MPETEKFTLTIRKALLRRVRDIAHERSREDKTTYVSDLIQDAVAAWLSAQSEPGDADQQISSSHPELKSNIDREENKGYFINDSAFQQFLRKHKKWVTLLFAVLESKNIYAVPSLEKNLEAFARLVHLDGAINEPPPDHSADALRELAELEELQRQAEAATDATRGRRKRA